MSTMTASELLASAPVHSISDTALILALRRKNGEPNRAAVHALVRSGAIRIVDPDQCVHRWTVSTVEINRYVEFGARSRADVVALGYVS